MLLSYDDRDDEDEVKGEIEVEVEVEDEVEGEVEDEVEDDDTDGELIDTEPPVLSFTNGSDPSRLLVKREAQVCINMS